MHGTDRGHVPVALVADLAAGVFEDDGRRALGRSRTAVRLEDDRRVHRRVELGVLSTLPCSFVAHRIDQLENGSRAGARRARH